MISKDALMMYLVFAIVIVGCLAVIYKLYNRGRVFYFKDKSGKQEIPSSEIIISAKTMVALTFGQSNSANHSNWKYKSKRKVFNYFEGKFYKAEDPLVGASDKGGSVWCYLSDLLIDNGLYENVIIVPIGIGDTSVELWGSGKCKKRLVGCLKELNKKKIKLTHFLYHQGETDNTIGTHAEQYKLELGKILATIKRLKQEAPIFISIATYNGSLNKEIQDAQKEFVRENQDVFLGANTDVIINSEDRFDGIHFSEIGTKKAAQSWYEAIVKESKE